jgi:hypothetical protein
MTALIMSTAFLARYGQTIIIATGLVLWLTFIVVYRYKMQDRKYKP